ncbi:MAG: hypothetical protein LBV41_01965 [Cytophagaceae bacterium]|jgi:hypothetical protein|nr:hypothetical protein [Cytophagaceae bacterium]
MKRLLFCLFFVLFTTISAIAQDDLFHNPVDAAVGNTGSTTTHAWSFFSNPAGISNISDVIAGIGYHHPYGIKELDSKTIHCIIPAKLLITGVGYTYYGFEYFNIQRENIVAARQIASWCQMGLRFNFLTMKQQNFESYHVFTVDGGIQLKPSEKIRIGFYAANVGAVRWKLPDRNEYQSSFVAAGVAYEPAKGVVLETGIVKDSKRLSEYSFALTVPLHKNIVFRGAGMSTPLRLGFGAGFKWKPFAINVGMNHHASLGFSSSFGLLFAVGSLFKDNK